MRPRDVFPLILSGWGIPSEDGLLPWKRQLGDGTIKCKGELHDIRRKKLITNIARGVHATVTSGPQTYRYVEKDLVVGSTEVNRIESLFRDQFSCISKESSTYFPGGD